MKIYSVQPMKANSLFEHDEFPVLFSTIEKARSCVEETYPKAKEVIENMWEFNSANGFVIVHIFETEVH